jgi:ATP-dependent DNA ligase
MPEHFDQLTALGRENLVQRDQTASDSGNTDALVFFLFDLLYIDGEVISAAPLHERKESSS